MCRRSLGFVFLVVVLFVVCFCGVFRICVFLCRLRFRGIFVCVWVCLFGGRGMMFVGRRILVFRIFCM